MKRRIQTLNVATTEYGGVKFRNFVCEKEMKSDEAKDGEREREREKEPTRVCQIIFPNLNLYF